MYWNFRILQFDAATMKHTAQYVTIQNYEMERLVSCDVNNLIQLAGCLFQLQHVLACCTMSMTSVQLMDLYV